MKSEKRDSNFQKEFLKFQNSKFQNRRRMAWITLTAYFVLAVYMLIRVIPEHFDKYDSFFIQITFLTITVLLAYFGGSSYEETRIDKGDLMREYKQLLEMGNSSRRNIKRKQQDDQEPEPDPNDSDESVG